MILRPAFSKNRLEAFSDGVIAIIITIMVLELKVPHDTSLHALAERAPVFLSYVLSFLYVGIYWNNHHHLLQCVPRVNGATLWANLHLLFWLSLVPFVTGWMGENHFAAVPTALYGAVLLASAIAFYLLQRNLVRSAGPDSLLRRAIGFDLKGKSSPLLYLAGIALSFLSPWLGCAIYTFVALLWLIPDRRMERAVTEAESIAASRPAHD